MKTKLQIFFLWLISICFLVSGCTKADGVWAPIKVDKDSFIIPAGGGEAIVNMKNYNYQWIGDIKIKVDGTEKYLYDYDDDRLNLETEWLKVSVPQDNTKQVIIKLQPNLGEMRIVQLRMTVGDTVHTIEIKQEKGK